MFGDAVAEKEEREMERPRRAEFVSTVTDARDLLGVLSVDGE